MAREAAGQTLQPTALPALLLSLVLHEIGPRLLGAEALASASPPRKADLVIGGVGCRTGGRERHGR